MNAYEEFMEEFLNMEQLPEKQNQKTDFCDDCDDCGTYDDYDDCDKGTRAQALDCHLSIK